MHVCLRECAYVCCVVCSCVGRISGLTNTFLAINLATMYNCQSMANDILSSILHLTAIKIQSASAPIVATKA